MADDLFIKPTGNSNQGQNSTSNQGSEPPVIDLRALDQASASGSGAGSSAGQTAANQGNQNPQAQTTPNQGQVQGAQATQVQGGQGQVQTQQVGQNQAFPANQTNQPQTKAPKQGVISLEDEANQYVTAGNQKYAIPKLVQEKFPDLIQLIQSTESMNDEEREYWFQILPIMTEPQIQKFRGILVNEKEQLSRLDKEYEDELKKLNEKHMIEWKAFESKEKRKALKEAEAKADVSEQNLEEELLQKLSQA